MVITAENDAQADAVLSGIRDLGVDYPELPIVSMAETSRELER